MLTSVCVGVCVCVRVCVCVWHCGLRFRRSSVGLTVIRCRINTLSQQMSDHKPVYSVFDCSMKTVVQTKRQNVLREIMRRLDKMENKSIPKAKLSTTVVHFPKVIYKQRCKQTVTIQNTGEVRGADCVESLHHGATDG